MKWSEEVELMSEASKKDAPLNTWKERRSYLAPAKNHVCLEEADMTEDAQTM